MLKRPAPVLRAANPMLDKVRVRLPDVFGFFSNWADFAANYDANGHAARVGLVFPPAPTNAIGPSDAEPGHMAAPFLTHPGVLEGEPWTDYEKSFVGGGVRPEGDKPALSECSKSPTCARSTSRRLGR